MKSTPRRDRMFALLSWLIVLGLLFAAFQVGTVSSLGQGPVASAVGISAMKAFYASIYTIQALLLTYSKVFKKKRLRKAVLMSIYLFMGFTTLLNIGVAGWTVNFIDNALIAVASALCWLHWKFRTEYIDPMDFDADTEYLL